MVLDVASTAHVIGRTSSELRGALPPNKYWPPSGSAAWPCEPPKTLEWQEVNLAAELVGYGSEAGAGYWILRVPWGVGWGEGGYMRVLRSEAAIFDAVAIDPMV